MRKSKLYLSVLASAAMIMSSSVVTMAAETDGTDTAAATATEETTTSETPETEVPETEAPETETPAEDVPETETPAEDVPETETPDTEAPETETPAEDVPETETPDAEAPAEDAPEEEAPAEETPETETPAEEGGVIYENEAGQKTTSEELGNWEWNEEKGKWQFVLESGDYLGGGIWDIDGTPYAFDKDGYMVTGWYTNEDGYRFYFNSNGAMRTGWLNDGGAWYYLQPNPVEDSWYDINGETYYFNKDGKMVTGWFFDEYVDYETGEVTGGDWYYLNSDGTMYDEGWLKQGDTYYYLDPYTGAMYKDGTYSIDGIDRLFDNSGRLLSGQWYFAESTNSEGVVTGGTWFYLNADGTRYKGWLKEGSTWYYLDEQSGAMYKNGTYTIDGKRYLFNNSGYLSSGWYFAEYRDYETGKVTGGEWYYGKADGTLYEGWLFQGGSWYYLWEDSGAMARDGVYYIRENAESFAFNDSGKMLTGWYFDAYTDSETGEVVSGDWYYFNASGYRQYGWIWDGAWYYLNEDYGYMYKDMFNVAIDGNRYSFNNSGVMLKGWQFDSYTNEEGEVTGGVWYYYNDSGAMQKGWIWDGAWYYLDRNYGAMYKDRGAFIDGKTYMFDNSGKMLTGEQWDDDAETWLYFNSDGSGYTGWRWANDADGVGHWYYYNNAVMYRNDTFYIPEDGRYAFFDADGVWTGYSPEPAEPAVNE